MRAGSDYIKAVCARSYNFELPSELLMKIKDKFIEKFMASQSLLDYTLP